jgi:crossover junction endodeoxyribonuclease RuvC
VRVLKDKKDKFFILGIDPGTLITGYGLICAERGAYQPIDYGCIKPPSSKKLTERYQIIYQGVTHLIEKYHPSAIAVETQYIQKNPQSGLKLGMARGVVLLAATLCQVAVYEYAPSQAKKSVVGTGRATKQQVQAMVQKLLFLAALPEPEDAADALALAICHAHAYQKEQHLQCQI